MLLAIDVGNTQTVFGLFDGERAADQFRVGTDPAHTADELAVMLRAFVELERARRDRALDDGAAARSASTSASPSAGPARSCSCSGPGVSTGVPIRYDDPREVGPDRIANAVAARERHGAPAIVVDFGTSTNFDVVSAAGEYVGGVLAPGIEISMDALFARAARLTKVPFAAPEHVIGKTTTCGAPVRPRLRLRRPGRRDRRPDPRRARRAGRAGDRHGRPRRADRAALADDHDARPGADAPGAAARLGAEPARAERVRCRGLHSGA